MSLPTYRRGSEQVQNRTAMHSRDTFLTVLTSAALLIVTACSTSAQPSRQSRQPGPAEVVARVGNDPITIEEVDARALQEPATSFGSAKLIQALYMARRGTIELIVANRLLDAEAKARGIDRPTLVEREIASKAPAPTEAEIQAWYQANPARVNGATLAQVHDPIRSLIAEERMETARASYVESLKTKTNIT